MRTCQSCGKENPADQDFCSCGEYLRWEPTGLRAGDHPGDGRRGRRAGRPAQAPSPSPRRRRPPPPRVTPRRPGRARQRQRARQRPRAAARAARAARAAAADDRLAARDRRRVQPPAPQPPPAKTLVRGAVPAPPPAGAPQAQRAGARSSCACPRATRPRARRCTRPSSPGQRERVLALVRNQSGIVDNYDLRVEGMPEDWWSIYPGTVYLVPFGSGGTYEQEVEVHLHPPRGPEAEARVWELKVVARLQGARASSRRRRRWRCTSSPTSRPRRRCARSARRAAARRPSTSRSTNKANAPVLVALDGEDPDGELQFGFNRPPQEIPAGAAVTSQMQVKPAEADLDRPRRRTAGWRSRPSPARRPPRAPPPSR